MHEDSREPVPVPAIESLLHELRVHQVELEAQNEALREAQGQLEESRSRYVDLYDFAPIPYVTFDSNGVVLEINLTGAVLFGRERRAVIGKPLTLLARLDHPEVFALHIRRCLVSNIPVTAELALTTEQGAMQFVLVSSSVKRPHGEPDACRTAFLDITQRRVAEREARAVHASERALRKRLEGIDRASAAVSAALARLTTTDVTSFLQVIADQARTAVRAEFAALGMDGAGGHEFTPWVVSGMSAEDAGRPIRLSDLREHAAFRGFPPGHPQMKSFLGVPVCYQGKAHGHLYFANKEGGDEFSEEDQLVAETLADRVAVAMEIARLRQIELRERVRLAFLAKAGQLLHESLDYDTTLKTVARLVVPELADFCTVDMRREDGSVSKEVAYDPDPARQRLLERLVGTTPPARVVGEIRECIATAQPRKSDPSPEFLPSDLSEAEYRALVGRLGAGSTILAPLIARGRVIGVLRLGMASSGRKYSDDDLSLAGEVAQHAALAIEAAKLYQAAHTAIRARDNLLAVVSHDLRNYLNTVRMAAELLHRFKSLAADAVPQVDAIKRAVSRMDQLIKALRDATMIETGHFAVEAREEDTGSIVDEASTTLRPLAEGRSLALRVSLEEPPPSASCDRERVLQVLTNLVSNAVKYTSAGGEIAIEVKHVGEWVRFAVSDTGGGIPESELPHVFERHWSAHRGKEKGTGLGLFIVKGIVEAHGGAIWVESKVGSGSTFYFTLPAASHVGHEVVLN